MSKGLLIAEKSSMLPSIKESLSNLGLSNEIDCETFAGHVVRQKNSAEYKEEWAKWRLDTLPMIPEKIEFVMDANKSNYYKNLENKIKSGRYDYLICATDAGREGNLIFAAFYEAIDCKLPIKRMWHSDLTIKAVSKALSDLLDWNGPKMKQMTDASYLRAYFDSLTGFNFTRAYTLANGVSKPINLGRVMSPMVMLVVSRELDILNFKQETYHQIVANLSKKNKNDDLFSVTALDKNEKVLVFKTKKEANDFISKLGKEAIVKDVFKNTVKTSAPELFSLASLQNEANDKYGYTLTETLEIAQSLYEKKYISYPRTDSNRVTKEVAKEFPVLISVCGQHPTLSKFIKTIKTADITTVSKNKKYVDDTKVTDHYALIPTEIVPNFTSLTVKERNVYDLICTRFIAIFYPPLVVNQTEITVLIDDNIFRTSGSILVDKGFSILFDTNFNDNILPNVEEKEILDVNDILCIDKKTTPPKRFTDKGLNIALEHASKYVDDKEEKEILKKSEGVGRPSTRGAILDKCLNIGFFTRKGKNIIPTQYAISVMQDLQDSNIVSLSLTAEWEGKLQKVENGELSYDNFYSEMIEYITKETLKLSKHNGGNIVNENEIGKCPFCGRPILNTGKFYKCTNYKGNIDAENPCEFIIGSDWFGTKIDETTAKKLITGEKTKEFSFKTQDGKSYKATIIYNKETKRIERVRNNTDGDSTPRPVAMKTGEKCPNCGHDMVLKKGKFGDFEACSNYPECKYIKQKNNATPVKETDEVCPNCGSPIVIKQGKFGEFKACSAYPKCKTIIK